MRPGGLLPFRIAHPLSSSDHPLSEASSLSEWGGKNVRVTRYFNYVEK